MPLDKWKAVCDNETRDSSHISEKYNKVNCLIAALGFHKIIKFVRPAVASASRSKRLMIN